MSVGIYSTIAKITSRKLVFAAVIVCTMITIGAVGFKYFEQFSWLDSFYTSAQTVTTVGYGDLAPTTAAGRIFAILLMLTGVGTVLFGLTLLAQAVIQSEMVMSLGNRRIIKEMEKLEGHYIICGAGRVGRRIIRSLERQNLPHVIIERSENRPSELDPTVRTSL